jgi:hypothetical protein
VYCLLDFKKIANLSARESQTIQSSIRAIKLINV